VIVLDQHAVGKVEAVILSATTANTVLVQDAQAGYPALIEETMAVQQKFAKTNEEIFSLALLLKDANDEKGFTTRSKMHLSFNDSTKTIIIDTPAGNSIKIDEQSMKIEIQDQNQNKISMEPSGIKLESALNIDIKAGAVLTLGAGTSLAISGPSLSVKADADVGISGATAKLSSSGITEISGSTVKIN